MHNRLRPKAGSLPLPKQDASSTSDPISGAAQQALPPWVAKRLRRRDKPQPLRLDVAFTALQEMRAETNKQAGYVRSLVFEDWIRRCLEDANEPREWTQARTLHESYLAHTRTFGKTEEARQAAVQAQATETQWGRMMATLYLKTRRGSGWHYPVKLKPGA